MVQPPVVSVKKFEDDLGLSSVGKLWVIDIRPVECGCGRDIEPSTDRVIVEIEHG